MASSQMIYEEKKEAPKVEALTQEKKNAVQILCNHFKIVTHTDDYAHFVYGPGGRSSNDNALLLWKKSNVKALRLDFPYARVDAEMQAGLKYLLSKRDLISLYFFVDGNALHISEGHNMKSLFKTASFMKSLREFTFRIHEYKSASFENKENLYSDLFESLSYLKELETLNLKILLFDIDDNHCLELLTRASSLDSLKNLSLDIREGSPISDKAICSLPGIFTKMRRLEELDLKMFECKKITQSGIQAFFENAIGGLKSLKKIALHLKGCSGVYIEDIKIPSTWEKDCNFPTIIVEKRDS